MKNLLLIFALLFIAAACGNNQKDLLAGVWEETGTTEHSQYTYNADGTYGVKYDDGTTVTGTWHIDDNLLYTMEEGTNEELSEEIVLLDDQHLKTQVAAFGMVLEMNFKRIK